MSRVAVAQNQNPAEPAPIPVNTTPEGGPPKGSFRANPRRSEEIVALRTRTSRTFQNDFGAMETDVFPGSIHYRAGDVWKPIDNTLVSTGAGFENRANEYRLQLPKVIGAAPVRVGVGSDFVALDLQATAGRPASTEKNVATYEDVFPGVDVRYQALNDAVKEDLLLEAADSTTEFTWRLDTSPSLTAYVNDTGGVDFVAADGSIPMRIPSPVIYDAAGPADGLSPPHRFELVQGKGEGWDELRLVVDEQWLSAPERTFPVTVDPTVDATGVQRRDCYITDAQPNQSFCGGAQMYAGKYGTTTYRSLVRFDVSGIPDSAEILNATFGLFQETAFGAQNGPNSLAVRRLTRHFTDGEANWNKSSFFTSWDTPGGDFNNEGFVKTDVTDVAEWKYWYITRTVKDWVAKGSSANHGIVVKAEHESGTALVDHRHTFSTNESGNNPAPRLTILWDHGGMGSLSTYKTEDKELTERRTQRINVASGNLHIQETDIKIKGLGVDLVFERSYNSLVQYERMPMATQLGTGWTISAAGDVGLKLFYDQTSGAPGKELPPQGKAAPAAVFFGPSGYRVPFVTEKTGGDYKRPPGLNADLTYNGHIEFDPSDDEYVLTFRDDGTKYVFNGGGQLHEIRSKNAKYTPLDSNDYRNKITFYYETDPNTGANRVKSIRDSQGRVTTFSYYSSGSYVGRLWQVTDPASRRHTFTYDGQKLATYTDPADGQTIYGYDAIGRLNRIRDPEGHEVFYDYTATNDNRIAAVRQVSDKTTTPWKEDKTTFTYGSATSAMCPDSQHAEGPKTTDVTDVTSVIDANQNAKPSPPNVGDASAPITRYCYDKLQRVRMIRDQQGNSTGLNYNSDHNVTDYIDTRNKKFSFSYETGEGPTKGNLTGTTGFAAGGTGASSPQTTKTEYKRNDLPGFPTAMVDAQGNRTEYGYDSVGNLTTVRQGVENDVATTTFKYVYNTDGNLTRIERLPEPDPVVNGVEQQGNDTILTYFPNGNLEKIDYPAPLGDVTYEYDNLSRVQKVTKGNGVQMWLSYDLQDHLARIWYPFNNNWSVTYTYDTVGNLKRRDDYSAGSTATSTYTYDVKNQPESETHPARNASGNTTVGTVYDFDPNGNLTQVSKGTDSTIYGYDSVNVLKTITERRPNTTDAVTEFTYNLAYQVKTITYPNGVKVEKDYDHAGNLDFVKASEKTQGTFVNLDYDYVTPGTGKDSSLLQKVTDMTQSPPLATTYRYDKLNRLAGARTVMEGTPQTKTEEYTYTYDKNSNLTRAERFSNGSDVKFDYNDANQLACKYTGFSCNDASNPGTTFTYDPNGNLATSNVGHNFNYDIRDRTTFMDNARSNDLGAGYRDETQVERTSWEKRSSSGAVLQAMYSEYDLLGLEREWNQTGGETITYIRDNKGTPVGQLNAQTTGNKKRYYVTDHLGSVIAATGGDGVVKGRYSYDPYGAMRTLTQDDVHQPWRFAGTYFDEATGLNKMGTRYYDPTVYRFTQMDPEKGEPANPTTLNSYAYAADDPVNNFDPTGRSCFEAAVNALVSGVEMAAGIAGIAAGIFTFAVQPELVLPAAELLTVGTTLATTGARRAYSAIQMAESDC